MQDLTLTRFQKLPASLLLLSNIIRAGSQWVLVWFYALFGGTEAVGVYMLALAIATPLFIAFDMSLRNVYVTLHQPIAFARYLVVRVSACVVALALLLSLTGFTSSSFSILLLVGLIKVADSVLDLAYGALQRKGRLTNIALTSLLNSTVSVAVGAVAYWWTRSIQLSLVGSLIGSVLTAMIVVIPVFRDERVPSSYRPFRLDIPGIIRAGVPSGLAFASVSLLTYLPIYFLGATASKSQVGVFAVLAYFSTFANLFYGSVQQSTLHTFVFHYGEGGDARLLQYAIRLNLPLTLVGVVSGTLTFVYGNGFVTLIYGHEFSLTQDELWPVAVSLMLLPAIYVPGGILLTKNLYGLQLIIGFVSLAASAAVGIAMYGSFNLKAASILILVGTGCRALLGLATAAFATQDKAGRQTAKSVDRRNSI